MAKKEQLIIGLDIGSHAVKICQLQKKGEKYRLLALGTTILSPGAVEDGVLQDPEDLSKSIVSLLKNLKIKNKKIGISISGYSVIVKRINLEYMSEDELEEYINTEAEQYIPFDLNEVYLDFKQIATNDEDEDRINVMIVAAKKEVVDDYVLVLQEQKLKPVLVDVDGFALENIWEHTTGGKDNVALIDIGASKMNINIVADGISVLARDIMVGSNQLTDQLANAFDIDEEDAEKIKLGLAPALDQEKANGIFNQTCTQWVMEIQKAIALYQTNNPERPLNNLYLSGGGSKVRGLPEYIQQETGMEVTLFNPFENMDVNNKKIDRLYLDAVAPEMAIAAGLAMRSAAF